ncbi:MAG: DUF2569 family protein [Allosphingosinicella sp.]
MNDYIEGPSGVGGWLGFFVVALGLLSPGAGLVQMFGLYSDPSIAAAFGDLWGPIQVAEWTLFALSIAGCWYLVWRLLNVQTRRTVRIVIAGLWLISVGGVTVEFIIVSLGSGLPIAALAGTAGVELVRPLVFCAIWTAYFLLSRRVANTYRDDPEGDALADVFG